MLADAGYTLGRRHAGGPGRRDGLLHAEQPDRLDRLPVDAPDRRRSGAKPLGIEATVDATDADTWFSNIEAGDFEASLHWTDGGATPWDIYADIMDGALVRADPGEEATWNFGRYQNDDVTAALETYASHHRRRRPRRRARDDPAGLRRRGAGDRRARPTERRAVLDGQLRGLADGRRPVRVTAADRAAGLVDPDEAAAGGRLNAAARAEAPGSPHGPPPAHPR